MNGLCGVRFYNGRWWARCKRPAGHGGEHAD